MPLSRSQIERLGVRLVRSSPPSPDDLASLHELLSVYGDALADAVAAVQRAVGITPTARIKNTGTILEKLERYGGSWLKSIQDIAGMRIVGTFSRSDQDEMAARLVELFDEGGRRPRLVDRRSDPSYGYTAVHVIAFVRSFPVEIQVRTRLQHEWADLFEKLADKVGRGIRYGEPPDHWLTSAERSVLAPRARKLYEIDYRVAVSTVDVAQAVAGLIQAYEHGEMLAPDNPRLREYRARVDAALAELGEELGQLSFIGRVIE